MKGRCGMSILISRRKKILSRGSNLLQRRLTCGPKGRLNPRAMRQQNRQVSPVDSGRDAALFRPVKRFGASQDCIVRKTHAVGETEIAVRDEPNRQRTKSTDAAAGQGLRSRRASVSTGGEGEGSKRGGTGALGCRVLSASGAEVGRPATICQGQE